MCHSSTVFLEYKPKQKKIKVTLDTKPFSLEIPDDNTLCHRWYILHWKIRCGADSQRGVPDNSLQFLNTRQNKQTYRNIERQYNEQNQDLSVTPAPADVPQFPAVVKAFLCWGHLNTIVFQLNVHGDILVLILTSFPARVNISRFSSCVD